MTGPVVYLLHYDKPLHHASHYLGASRNLEERIARHRYGHSTARITAAFHDQGSTFVVARTWETPRAFELESHIKKHFKKATVICPICTPGTQRGEFKEFMP